MSASPCLYIICIKMLEFKNILSIDGDADFAAAMMDSEVKIFNELNTTQRLDAQEYVGHNNFATFQNSLTFSKAYPACFTKKFSKKEVAFHFLGTLDIESSSLDKGLGNQYPLDSPSKWKYVFLLELPQEHLDKMEEFLSWAFKEAYPELTTTYFPLHGNRVQVKCAVCYL